ncbi:MAG: succinate--CoA ligase subunit beta, partial [Gemmatimonadales bacterium]
LKDDADTDPLELRAQKASLNYIKLDGQIACLVNGAGLAMATMDLVKYYGGDPANFLDIGGSSNPEKVVNALRIITSDPNVKGILFNIFGGITRTDDVANGLKTALAKFPVKVPIVVRLTGTNEAEAVKILKGIGMEALSDMDEAVARVVKLVREAA